MPTRPHPRAIRYPDRGGWFLPEGTQIVCEKCHRSILYGAAEEGRVELSNTFFSARGPCPTCDNYTFRMIDDTPSTLRHWDHRRGPTITDIAQ